jgi:hypothetical protein
MPYVGPASAGLEEIPLKADATGDFFAGNQQVAILQSTTNLQSEICNLKSRFIERSDI